MGRGNRIRWRRRMIRSLLVRDGSLCSICCYPMKLHARTDDPDTVTIDHRVPKSRGGTNYIDNLQLAHKRCNADRGDAPWPGGPEAP